jgi:hypothetical protein
LDVFLKNRLPKTLQELSIELYGNKDGYFFGSFLIHLPHLKRLYCSTPLPIDKHHFLLILALKKSLTTLYLNCKDLYLQDIELLTSMKNAGFKLSLRETIIPFKDWKRITDNKRIDLRC